MIHALARVALTAVFIALVPAVLTAQAEKILVPSGATWKYLDDGSDQGTAWREATFSDTAWKSGKARLGYGSDGEVTTVSFGPDPDNKFTTTYFRRTITVADPAAFKTLIVKLLCDDGAVIYVNGREVFRYNTPDGAVTAYTRTPLYMGNAEWVLSTIHLVSALVQGQNVIAVEVHQQRPSSSDLAFDLELIGSAEEVTAVPPSGTAAASAASAASGYAGTDGPYVLWHGDTAATVLAICNDTVRKSTVRTLKDRLIFQQPCGPSERVALSAASPTMEVATVAKAPRRIFAVSDVEGNYDTFVALLKSIGVVNAEARWAWGRGHLVLVGDMVDRGTKVTEVLWLIHRLEQEAKKAGGRVHYVLGNHDAMLLYGNHKYVANKYFQASGQLGVPLLDLFAPTTEFGRWMRSKPVMVRIDTLLFVHGGVDPQFAARRIDVNALNNAVRAGLLDSMKRKSDSLSKLVFGSDGPLWYRGYFSGSSPTPSQVKEALAQYGASTVVVGHTIVDKIKRLHDGRVVAIDVTLETSEKAHGLLIEQGKFYSVNIKGERAQIE